MILWILAFAGLFGALGYLKKEIPGAIAGAFAGGLLGFIVNWFMQLAWWQQTLLALGTALGIGAAVYFLVPVVIGAIVVLLAVFK